MILVILYFNPYVVELIENVDSRMFHLEHGQFRSASSLFCWLDNFRQPFFRVQSNFQPFFLCELDSDLNIDGFFDDDFGRVISSPLQGSSVQPSKFFSQQVSPILTRHRSLTASQVIFSAITFMAFDRF